MSSIPINIAEQVGRTPMVQLTRLLPDDAADGVQLFGKLESRNPGGSVKDRIGVSMLEAAEREERIEPGKTTIVEATSGNTGIALAFVCAAKGYDLVLFTNFFHHFDKATCEMLMKKAAAALNEGGRAVTLEFAPNEDRISPPPLATFGLVMLASTAAGEAYTVGDYDQMFRNAGYARTEMHELKRSPQRVIVSYK